MTEQEMMESVAYRGVVAAPGADLAREDLADWLTDRWPVRARYIRLATAHARARRRALPGGMPHGARSESGIDLLLANEGEWGLPARSLGWLKKWNFVRGVIGFVRMDAQVFLDRADELFSIFPVRQVGLDACGPVIDAVAASPHLSRLVGLSLRESSLGDRHMEVLASSPHIRNLRWLDLYENRIGVSGFEALCASPHLESLLDITLLKNAAPNPAQDCGYEWTGAKHIGSLPAVGCDLERRYGYKRWLHGAELIYDYPPSYSTLDGDDP